MCKFTTVNLNNENIEISYLQFDDFIRATMTTKNRKKI